MQSLRIALGLCGLLLAWVWLVPAGVGPVPAPAPTPSPFAASPAPQRSAGLARTSEAPPSTNAERSAPAVRMVGPVAIETGATLNRLPAATSGAATPPVAAFETARAPSPDAAPSADPETAPEGGPEAAPFDMTPETPETAEANAPPPLPLDPSGARRVAAPVALDTGTIRAGEATIRIAGVAPLAPGARCADGPRSWPCGVRARTEFRAWLRGRTLLCDAAPAEAPEAPVACRMADADVADWLVRNGWADAEAGSAYEATAREARQARRGIWQFEIEP